MKKLLTMFLVLTLCLSFFTSALAIKPGKISTSDIPQIAEVVSPECPDAYILTEYYAKDSDDVSDISINNEEVSIAFDEEGTALEENKTFTIKDSEFAQALEDGEEEIIGVVEATAFFEEEYEIVNEQGEQIVRINNSRLLTKEEVESIGVDNFDSADQLEPTNTISTMVSGSTTNSRGKLTISFILTELSSSGYAGCYNLRSDSSWSGLPLFPELGGSENPGYG